ncbi:hypothetical protein PIB30_097074 [Stylosanthes scabra]|uniref:Uncharacterized protein n=1 Tax=Stylosanthes scabra TaxID=79078 RepID=A0ABU6QWF8_9FABA|nr:hypothetical protein [Stylosanthes scabra]
MRRLTTHNPTLLEMSPDMEAGPALKSGPGFESGRIPNPGDFPSSISNRVLLFCNAPILSSNMSVHESASRFGPALRLPRRSLAESATFGLHDLTPIQLRFTWLNRSMVQPNQMVNWST